MWKCKDDSKTKSKIRFEEIPLKLYFNENESPLKVTKYLKQALLHKAIVTRQLRHSEIKFHDVINRDEVETSRASRSYIQIFKKINPNTEVEV